MKYYDLTPAQWRELRVRPAPGNRRARRLAFANRKGGSGKTTETLCISAALAMWGARVRMTDGDPQRAALTYWMPPVLDGARVVGTLLDVCQRQRKLDEVTYPTTVDNLWIVPSMETLGKIEMERPIDSDRMFQQAYDATAMDIDVEAMDLSPSLGLVSIAMLAAADELALLVTSSSLDMVGADELQNTLPTIRTYLNPDLHDLAVVMVDEDKRTRLSRAMHEQFAQEYPEALICGIPHSVRLREAPGQHLTIYDYAPDNAAALANWNLAANLVGHLGLEWVVSPEQVAA